MLEDDSTIQNLQQSTQETQPEDIYELLYDAPDNYFPQQPTHSKSESTSEFHHSPKNYVPIKTSCNSQKQPLLNEDPFEHMQFQKERNLSYLPILFTIEATTPHVLHTDGLRKTHN